METGRRTAKGNGSFLRYQCHLKMEKCLLHCEDYTGKESKDVGMALSLYRQLLRYIPLMEDKTPQQALQLMERVKTGFRQHRERAADTDALLQATEAQLESVLDKVPKHLHVYHSPTANKTLSLYRQLLRYIPLMEDKTPQQALQLMDRVKTEFRVHRARTADTNALLQKTESQLAFVLMSVPKHLHIFHQKAEEGTRFVVRDGKVVEGRATARSKRAVKDERVTEEHWQREMELRKRFHFMGRQRFS
eukprot:g47151.t1